MATAVQGVSVSRGLRVLSADTFARINTTTGPRWVVIINPDSGPGNCSTPNSDFVAGIKQLNSYPNVQTIGYVRTGYGGRNTSEILRDIDTYSGWSYSSPDLSMHGIFFDEAVYEYSPDAAETLQIIDYHAKNASGIAGSRLVGLPPKMDAFCCLLAAAAEPRTR